MRDSSREFPQHFAEYDAYLFTSLEHDPFPVTVIQAVLSPCPCLFSAGGSVYELMRDVEGLIHYEPGDSSGLADAVEAFWGLQDQGQSLVDSCILRMNEATAFENIQKR